MFELAFVLSAVKMAFRFADEAVVVDRTVDVHIGKLHILQGVNLEVRPGESAALLGRNGVGKTTTLRAIMGLVSKSSGAIRFDEFDLSN